MYVIEMCLCLMSYVGCGVTEHFLSVIQNVLIDCRLYFSSREPTYNPGK